jgi:ATP-binding cassette subfamily B multidrug efflux pump
MFGDSSRMRHLMSGETLKPRALGDTLSRFGQYFARYWPSLVLVLFFILGSTWAQVTNPELIGETVDCYLTPVSAPAQSGGQATGLGAAAATNCWLASDSSTQDVDHRLLRSLTYLGTTQPTQQDLAALDLTGRIAGLGRLIVLIISLYVFGAILTGSAFFTMAWTGQHVLRQMRVDVFRHLHRLSVGYYTEHEAGDLMSRITNDASTIEQAFGFALIQVSSGALLLILITVSMLAKSLGLALLALLVVPVMAGATFWFSEQARKAFRRSREEMGSVNAELQETISSVREVQAFNRADENINQFRLINAANRDANVRAVAYTAALAPTLEALGYVALATVICVGGLFLLRGQPLLGSVISLGLIVTFVSYVQRFNQPIQQIAVLWTNVQSAIAGGERIFNLLDEVPSVQDKPGAQPIPQIQGAVEFDHASAEYTKNVPVLKGVTFKAEPGQTVAIVGPTGAGKTTIINLIPRFYDVTGGAVRIDGRDVREVTAESLRQQIGIVLQDTFLFSATVMENIRFGRPGASDEDVIAAAKLAHADAFIERLPEGYNTTLGERGSGLSQGQRQLLAIARAALADPRILILDEATSSVDTRTERLIQQALDRLLAGRTSFVIAHRLSTIRNADQVLVLDHGEIIERGKHDDLLARRGFYYNLYMSQFRQDGEEQPVPGENGHSALNWSPAGAGD